MSLDMIRSIQDRQNGASTAFLEVDRLLNNRVAELQAQIVQQEQELQEKQQTHA